MKTLGKLLGENGFQDAVVQAANLTSNTVQWQPFGLETKAVAALNDALEKVLGVCLEPKYLLGDEDPKTVHLLDALVRLQSATSYYLTIRAMVPSSGENEFTALVGLFHLAAKELRCNMRLFLIALGSALPAEEPNPPPTGTGSESLSG